METPEWSGPPRYVITDLGTLGGSSSVALAINEREQVVGSADTADGVRHAYLWEDGRMTELGTLPGHFISEAWAVSEVTHIAANSSFSGGSWSAFVWQNGLSTDLGDLVCPDTHAYGINTAGRIVGTACFGGGQYHAFLWEDGQLTDLTEAGFPSGIAWAINESSHIVGGRGLWHDGQVTLLGSLGGENTGALDLNDVGQVVGSSDRVPGPDLVFHAFLWDKGVMTDLGALAGFSLSSYARAINNHGQVVGTGKSSAVEDPFIYQSGEGFSDLHDLLPLDAGWRRLELSPRDINDKGQIVGSASFPNGRHAFLMTPIDADFDDDGDVDLEDHGAFSQCMTGLEATYLEDCKTRDIDRDGDIDMMDFRVIQWVFDGP